MAEIAHAYPGPTRLSDLSDQAAPPTPTAPTLASRRARTALPARESRRLAARRRLRAPVRPRMRGGRVAAPIPHSTLHRTRALVRSRLHVWALQHRLGRLMHRYDCTATHNRRNVLGAQRQMLTFTFMLMIRTHSMPGQHLCEPGCAVREHVVPQLLSKLRYSECHRRFPMHWYGRRDDKFSFTAALVLNTKPSVSFSRSITRYQRSVPERTILERPG